MKNSFQKKTCRVCTSSTLQRVLSLGKTPPANAFLKSARQKEEFFPLNLDFCKKCSFVQLADVVSPELLFKNYVYVSSTSPSFVAHFEELAKAVTEKHFPKTETAPLIIDIGSNDGILLRPFKNLGWRVLGVDPATKIAKMATASGIETLPKFFSPEEAKKIAKKYGKAKLVTATSVFPHIDDLDKVLTGVKELLDEDGVFMIEAYYLLDLLKKNLFDTIYHEHLSYFTTRTASQLFKRLGMELFDVERTDTHGGSLRLFAQRKNGQRKIEEKNIQKFLKEEQKNKIHLALTHVKFSNSIEDNKKRLLDLLKKLKTQGKKIVGYGAPAKGNTLLNYFKIGPDVLDYIVDDSPWKQGLLTPGTHIPVVSSAEIEKNKPDYVLILAWNFAEQIMKKLADFSAAGGKFIVPVPKPRIVTSH